MPKPKHAVHRSPGGAFPPLRRAHPSHRYWSREPHETRLRRWLRDAGQDLPYAIRQMRLAPASTAFIVATLALGIGANATMVGVLDRLLLRPPPGLSDPDGLVRLLTDSPSLPVPGSLFSYPDAVLLNGDSGAFSAVAATSATLRELPLGNVSDATTQTVRASLVSANFFDVLGASPSVGRFFSPADGYPRGALAGGPALAVLSHGLWKRQFGGDPTVVGRLLKVGEVSYTVVGVASERFNGATLDPVDIWLPVTVAAQAEMTPSMLENEGRSWIHLIARLRPDVSRETATDRATSIMRHGRIDPSSRQQDRTVVASIILARGPDAGPEVRVALWLGGLSILVLLIACANVANLLLARAFVRRREIGVRLALGASRGRIARQILVEAGLLSLLGASAALALAAACGSVARSLVFPASPDSSFIGGRVLITTAVIALSAGVLICCAPLVQSLRRDLTESLRVGSATGGGRTARVRAVLLGGQAALCMLLLVVAALFSESLRQVIGLDLGMDVDRTLTAYPGISPGAMTGQAREALGSQLTERIGRIPGVERVAFRGGVNRAVIVRSRTRDVEHHLRATGLAPYEIAVSSGYFSTLGTSLRGRDFAESDRHGAPSVAIINEPLARVLFPSEEALGQCVYLPTGSGEPGDECRTVVGVLSGHWYGTDILEREGLLVYVPMAQSAYALGASSGVAVRTKDPAGALMDEVREAILDVAPHSKKIQVRWMREIVEPQLRPWRVSALLFGLFALVALAVATMGLYAVVAFNAVQRAPDIAVRMALGARTIDVIAAVSGDGLKAVCAGLALGGGAAVAIQGWIRPMLFQTSPTDARVFIGVATLLLGAAIIAGLVPILSTLRRSPSTVLRAD